MVRAVLIGAGLGVIIDLLAAWLILEIVDGPEFPY